jgi:hypothetical protein
MAAADLPLRKGHWGASTFCRSCHHRDCQSAWSLFRWNLSSGDLTLSFQSLLWRSEVSPLSEASLSLSTGGLSCP